MTSLNPRDLRQPTNDDGPNIVADGGYIFDAAAPGGVAGGGRMDDARGTTRRTPAKADPPPANNGSDQWTP